MKKTLNWTGGCRQFRTCWKIHRFSKSLKRMSSTRLFKFSPTSTMLVRSITLNLGGKWEKRVYLSSRFNKSSQISSNSFNSIHMKSEILRKSSSSRLCDATSLKPLRRGKTINYPLINGMQIMSRNINNSSNKGKKLSWTVEAQTLSFQSSRNHWPVENSYWMKPYCWG